MSAYEVTSSKDTYTLYELKEEATSSRVTVCPERGGIVLNYAVRGEELLYLDRDTFLDPKANIRGGIPVLFPICGYLTDGQYEWKGRTYTMKNHGVARTHPWEAVDSSEDEQASLTLKLESCASTLESFPFEFELLFTYTLKDAQLHIEQEYRNLSSEEMPMYAGFHPYFAADRKDIAYDTDATTYMDYNDHLLKPYQGRLDLNTMVESANLLDARKRRISFQPTQKHRISMNYSDEFAYVMLWSVPDKPFVCVEPWMTPPDELNRKRELTMVAPGESLRCRLVISCEQL